MNSTIFGDPDWIRTSNLPLRRGLLYPVEPRGRCDLFADIYSLLQGLGLPVFVALTFG
jgi:hypothetical protein